MSFFWRINVFIYIIKSIIFIILCFNPIENK
nr:MAG TPA: hypothetical protein [Caudoviricetes sp.]